MGFDPVPWFVEGGAQHSAQVARLVAYLLLGGQEGVLGGTDLAVRELATPGGSVRVSPGGVGVVNRAAGQDRQTYIGRVISDDVVAVNPTTSTGGRSDMVVARVENPWLSGEPWQQPAAPASGPYIFSRVLQGVPASARTLADVGLAQQQSAVPLARIDIPASTGTITQAMITDLRTVVNPMTGIGVGPGSGGAEKVWTITTNTPGNSLLPAGAAWQKWPVEASWNVPIPAWATDVDVLAILTPEMLGNAWGQERIVIDGVPSAITHFDDNYISPPGGGGMRTVIRVSTSMSIAPTSRGRTVEVHLEGSQQSTNGAGLTVGSLKASDGSTIYLQLNFKQKPVLA